MKKLGLILMVTTIVCLSCNPNADKEGSLSKEPENFEFVVDRFADIKIMRYRVDNWDQLSLNQKKLVYYLSEAACCGRDIIFDQNCKYNLYVRHYLDEIVLNFNGDTTTLDWKNFMVYTKRFWFSNGMHHHYSNDKFYPEVSKEYFGMLLDSAVFKGDKDSKEIKETRKEILNIIFNPQIAPKRIAQDTKQDLVKNSAVNFYDGVSQQEVEKYYA
ncbi:MAG TPA: dihydrofolate reductase, partial [Bacteroidales bacterium]|nr:dihydrofolate reductase [Bacteroidales bacterium]